MQYKKELTDAIEKTLVAKQIALQKIEELKVQKNENEILVERAKGAALVQEERSKHLTPLLVQQQAVEALSKMAENPNKTTIIFIPVGSGGLPVIDAGQVLNAVQKQMDGHPVQAEAKK
jgi:superfamily II DNA or RNA helicase